jgi:hypothetical protein
MKKAFLLVLAVEFALSMTAMPFAQAGGEAASKSAKKTEKSEKGAKEGEKKNGKKRSVSTADDGTVINRALSAPG